MDKPTKVKQIIPWIVAIALFMETLDTTIIITAIPKIALSFMINPIDLKLALTSYLLSLALFIPVSGWVADKWGAQRTFLFALVVFTLSSVGCGMASHLYELVIARCFQGIGGAFMMPVGRLILLRTFPKSELVSTMNFMAMPALLGPMLGPLVGGFITTYYSWPWIFYVNVPMGCLGIIATLYHIKNTKIKSLRPFDITGFFLFGISLAGLFFAFESIGEHFIPTYVTALICSCALLGFLLFYWHYQKTRDPMLNFNLLSIRTFFIAAVGNFWVRLGTSSVSFLLPLLLQIGYGLSPLQSGLLTGAWALGMISVKFFINKFILRRFGFRKMLLATSILTGITISSFALINEINVPIILTLCFINGAVTSLQNNGMNMLYYMDVASVEMSHATSISNTWQQVSVGFGIVLSTLVLQLFAGWNHPLGLGNPFPFRWTFVVMGAITALSVLIFLKVKPKDGRELSNCK